MNLLMAFSTLLVILAVSMTVTVDGKHKWMAPLFKAAMILVTLEIFFASLAKWIKVVMPH